MLDLAVPHRTNPLFPTQRDRFLSAIDVRVPAVFSSIIVSSDGTNPCSPTRSVFTHLPQHDPQPPQRVNIKLLPADSCTTFSPVFAPRLLGTPHTPRSCVAADPRSLIHRFISAIPATRHRADPKLTMAEASKAAADLREGVDT